MQSLLRCRFKSTSDKRKNRQIGTYQKEKLLHLKRHQGESEKATSKQEKTSVNHISLKRLISKYAKDSYKSITKMQITQLKIDKGFE